MKCLYSIRDLTVAEAVDKDHNGKLFLERDRPCLRLKRNHMHWFQEQGQLLLTGAAVCDFVTFTRKDLLVERILPDSTAMDEILQKLTNVYIEHVIQFLQKKQCL